MGVKQNSVAKTLKANGMSLVEVIVALAIVTVGGLAAMAAIDMMTGVSLRSGALHEVDQTARLAQSVMDRVPLCRAALRDVSGNLNVLYDGSAAADVGQIVSINPADPAAAPMVVARVNSDVSAGTFISRIYLRPPVGVPATDVTFKVAGVEVAYKAFIADLVIEFDERAGSAKVGGQLRPREIPVRIASPAAGPPIVNECPGDQLGLISVDCQADILPTNECAAVTPMPQPDCRPIYYIAGFDPYGRVNCRCQWSCGPPVTGGTDSGTGPGAADSQGMGDGAGAL